MLQPHAAASLCAGAPPRKLSAAAWHVQLQLMSQDPEKLTRLLTSNALRAASNSHHRISGCAHQKKHPHRPLTSPVGTPGWLSASYLMYICSFASSSLPFCLFPIKYLVLLCWRAIRLPLRHLTRLNIVFTSLSPGPMLASARGSSSPFLLLVQQPSILSCYLADFSSMKSITHRKT